MTHASSPTARLLESYEALPYQGNAIPPTHPDSIAAMVRLYGIEPADVRRCRVLDLGCATGGNVIAMAQVLPECTFVGVDLSPRQIASARELASALNLGNVRFEAMSITDVDEGFGTFDYILSHGVFSWVPPEVQTALLVVCGRHLAPNGVAYVSYNTYPGWHLRGLVRDMLLFHDRPGLSPEERVSRGRALVEFLAGAVPDSEHLYGALIKQEYNLLSESTDTYFLHEELEAVNRPVYFRDFAEQATHAGLQVVCEAVHSAVDAQLTQEIRDRLRGWSDDDVGFEQYMDFLRGRGFRRSLLCRAGVPFEKLPSPAPVRFMYLAARCTEDHRAARPSEPAVEVFRTPDGLSVTMNHPVLRAALHVLIDARPMRLHFSELLRRTRVRLSERDGEVASDEMLADAMLRCALVTLVKLHVVPAVCTDVLSERPRASGLSRLQSRLRSHVTTLTNQNIEIEPLQAFLLSHADGTHDRDAFIDLAQQAVACGELTLPGGSGADRSEIEAAVSFALRVFLLSGVFEA